MNSDELDNVDRGVLYLLQQNARDSTTTSIGDKVGVSSSTVGNRIQKLEENGVIRGYHPLVDYERTGLGYHLLVTATVSLDDQDEIEDDIMGVIGVVSVRTILSNRENLSIELVGPDRGDIEESMNELHALGIEIERTGIMKTKRRQPYDHFGKEHTSEGDPG